MRNIAKLLILCLGMSVAGCAGYAPPSAQPASAAAPQLVLGPGDKLRVDVFGETTITGEYVVGNDGRLILKLLGPIDANGKTIDQLQAVITQKLSSGIMVEPRVTVDVVSYRPFYILGEVQKPGQYPYVTVITADQAVATAGGYTYRGDKTQVYIKHADETSEKAYELRPGRPVWVVPGDTIRIIERFF